jgi:hypothetical protein
MSKTVRWIVIAILCLANPLGVNCALRRHATLHLQCIRAIRGIGLTSSPNRKLNVLVLNIGTSENGPDYNRAAGIYDCLPSPGLRCPRAKQATNLQRPPVTEGHTSLTQARRGAVERIWGNQVIRGDTWLSKLLLCRYDSAHKFHS